MPSSSSSSDYSSSDDGVAVVLQNAKMKNKVVLISSDDEGDGSSKNVCRSRDVPRVEQSRDLIARGLRTFGLGTYDTLVGWLKHQVHEYPPIIPLYVCKMNKSTVMRKSKMIFSANFTRNHLEELLAEPVQVLVSCPNRGGVFVVRLMNAKNDARAIITSNWTEVVKAYKIKCSMICVFAFHNIHWIRLEIIPFEVRQ